MVIVWDEPKRLANLAKHGIDFADLTVAFFEAAVIRSGHSGRLLALGRQGKDSMLAVVFAPLGSEAVSIISMRPARADERRLLR